MPKSNPKRAYMHAMTNEWLQKVRKVGGDMWTIKVMSYHSSNNIVDYYYGSVFQDHFKNICQYLS